MFIVLSLFSYPMGFSQASLDSVRYELYVRCCMGEVSPNIYEFNYSVYKDSTFICYLSDPIMLADTGVYTFVDHDDRYMRHFDSYGIYRDTFDLFRLVTEVSTWDPQKKDFVNPHWECDGCVMDGYIVKKHKTGAKDWEGFYKEGKKVWYKEYDDEGNLIYYMKRNLWGKRKVVLDERDSYWDKKYKERKDYRGPK